MIRWYAEKFGIGDIDCFEVQWVADWVKRNHNRLRRDEISCRWYWIEHKER